MKFKYINSKFVLAVLSVSVSSGFQNGYHYGVTNMAHKGIMDWISQNKKERFKKIPTEKENMLTWSVVVSVYSIGGMLGSAMTKYFANRFGHKGGIMLNNYIMFLASFFIIFAKSAGFYEVFVIGRFLIGIHAGLSSGLCPIYLSEIAPVPIRGSTTTMYCFVFTLSFCLSSIFSTDKFFGAEWYWVHACALGSIFGLVQLIILYLCPESPRFLMMNLEEEDKAKEALIWFRNTEDIVQEIKILKEQREVLKKLPRVTCKTLFSKSIYRSPLIIALAMVFCQQSCGMETLFSYSALLLDDIRIEAYIPTIGMGVTLGVSTLTCVILIDTLGRRVLFFVSLCGVAIDTIFLTIVLQLAADDILNRYMHVITIFAVIVLAGWYALGTACIPVVLTVELFHQLARPLAVSIVVPFSWFTRFVVNMTFLPLTQVLKFYTYLIYICLDLMLFVFLHFYLPETKGKTIKDITRLFTELELDDPNESENIYA